MKYHLFDAHCDTLVKAYEENKILFKNDLHIDFERLMKYDSPLQFFAMWIDKKYFSNAFDRTNKYIDFFESQIAENKNIVSKVHTYEDYINNKKNGRISAFLAIEGGEAIEDKIENLVSLYNRGVRAMTLTWNYANLIADGTGVEEPKGLTEFGREVVCTMNKLGMIVDVSHLADKSFWDVCEEAKKPFIATHSNARSICSHKRNLTDKQLKTLADKGGVTGLNIYSKFISDNEYCDISDVLKHVDHILNVAGEDVLGIGCDLDGIETMPEGFSGVESLEYLLNTISDKYGERIAEKIAFKNFSRVLNDTL
ncbi:MAG: membrane dipeptidase [Lachnospiraceae bacterium]|nr:membrane dipeptidase [Lachnospiraceae bacterium]